MKSSRSAVKIKIAPKPFFKSPVSNPADSQVQMAALIHPENMAGSNIFELIMPCFHRNRHATSAEGIKNNRLIPRAMGCGTSSTMVSQRISRLPPPIPIPERKPSTVPRSRIKGKESTIDTGNLPTRSKSPIPCEATLPGFSFPKDLRKNLLPHCR